MKNSLLLSSATLLILSMVTLPSFAACDKHSCEGVTNVILESITADEENFYITFPRGVNETLSCELIGGTNAKLRKEASNYSSMQSMLLTAVTSNLPLSIRFNTDSAQCQVDSVSLKVFE